MLVVAGAILTVCVLAATILLASGDNGSAGALPPTATKPPAYFAVWNDTSGAWQTEDLDMTAEAGAQPAAAFLLTLATSERATHEFEVTFQCDGNGQILLTALPSNSATNPALASPGPGRSRPDTEALERSLALWGATFSGPPTWDTDGSCGGGQALTLKVTARSSTVAAIWNAQVASPASGNPVKSFTASASVDGSPAGAITVRVPR